VGGQHRHASRGPRPLTIAAAVVIAPVALLTVVAIVLLWPRDLPTPDTTSGVDEFRGTVSAVTEEPCPEPPADYGASSAPAGLDGCGTATVRLDSGSDRGEEVETLLPTGAGAPEVSEGDGVVLIRSAATDEAGEPTYSIVDQQRASGLWVLAGAFALSVVAFGRWRGLMALVGLGVTFGVLVLFVVPAVLVGSSPLLVALVGASAITLTVLYLTHGFSFTTTVAVLGTLASLALTGLLSLAAVSLLHLTGVTDDNSASIGVAAGLSTEGLLLAGIVIGSLGVLDDVTVTQAATVEELSRASPRLGALGLYRAAARVGRSHIASVINTIVLAYAGSSLPLLVLIVGQRDSLGSVLTDQVIAQEIARSAVATLGLVAAVPLTTALAALASREARRLT